MWENIFDVSDENNLCMAEKISKIALGQKIVKQESKSITFIFCFWLSCQAHTFVI